MVSVKVLKTEKIPFSKTSSNRYKISTIPHLQRMLNKEIQKQNVDFKRLKIVNCHQLPLPHWGPLAVKINKLLLLLFFSNYCSGPESRLQLHSHKVLCKIIACCKRSEQILNFDLKISVIIIMVLKSMGYLIQCAASFRKYPHLCWSSIGFGKIKINTRWREEN